MQNIAPIDGIAGLRDYYPEDWVEINYILSSMRDVALRYNYSEYEGPSLEPIELFEAKSGEGLLGEVFHVYDGAQRHLVLRPEQTPTLARMLAKEQQRYAKPMRWFSIPRLFRDETPQKGRTKEFWQLNVDILGEKSIAADAEVIAVAVDIIRTCGIQDNQFKVYVNNRNMLNQFLEQLDLGDRAVEIIRIIDRKMKYVQKYVQDSLENNGMPARDAENMAKQIRKLLNAQDAYLDQLLSEIPDEYHYFKINQQAIEKQVMTAAFAEEKISASQIEKIFNYMSIAASPDNFAEEVTKLELGECCTESIAEFAELTEYLKGFGVIEPIIYDLSLARGLDYYTGIVFEAFDASGNIVRALCGGGRYSNLVETLGGQPLEGSGFGMGDLALLEFIKNTNLQFSATTEQFTVYLAPIKKETTRNVLELATKLRAADIKVVCNPFKWKIKRHLNVADKENASYAIFIGPKDVENQLVSMRKIEDGSNEAVNETAIIEKMLKLKKQFEKNHTQ